MIGGAAAHDAVRLGGIASLVAGVLALFVPYFLGLAEASAALAAAAWFPGALEALRPSAAAPRRSVALLGSFGIVGSWGIYLGSPVPFDRPAAALLGAVALALAWSTTEGPHRRRSR